MRDDKQSPIIAGITRETCLDVESAPGACGLAFDINRGRTPRYIKNIRAKRRARFLSFAVFILAVLWIAGLWLSTVLQ